MFIQYRYQYQISLVLSHWVILLYPSISLDFIPLSSHGARICLGFFCRARLFFGSNALPISFNILSYPFTQPRGEKLHTSCLETSIFCTLTSRLDHYATILDIKRFLLVYVTDADAGADTLRRRRQQREPMQLLRRVRDRRCCWPADAIDI